MIDKKILLNIFLILGCFVGGFYLLHIFSSCQLNPAIDTGREFYIPYRMLNGEVLYKDIFNIYGALAYQINLFAYKLFGATVNALRYFGVINALLITAAITFICAEFDYINDKKAGILPFLPVFIGVFCFGTFNYVVPYSFAMTYGLCFFLISLLFFIKFSKTDIPKFAYLACLFAGGTIACKYEFFTYFLFLLVYVLLCRNISTKNVIISIFMLCVIPLFSFGTLFMQGMTIDDLSKTADIMKIMANTDAIKYLYTNFTGTYFNLKVFGICLYKTVMLLGVLSVIFLTQKVVKSDKFLTLMVFAFSVLGIFYIGTTGFSLLAIINALIFVIYLKKIFQNKPLFVYMSSTILLSLKTFFAVNTDVYGTYTLPFIVISIVLFLYQADYSKNEELKINLRKTAFLAVVGLIFLCLTKTVTILINKNTTINIGNYVGTNTFKNIQRNIVTYPHIANPINQAIEYINSNTELTDRIVVLPETQFLNFVTKRPADNLYDSLTPMYFETFGEENIIDHFRETKPEYFILNNRNTADYGKRYICEDYGKEFCSFVKENYKKVETFGEKQYILQVFKRKDLL